MSVRNRTSTTPAHKKAEQFNVDKDMWTSIQEYPYANEYIIYAPIVNHRGAFYVFGGFSGVREQTIGRLDPSSGTWSRVGQLVTGRAGHNVIFDGVDFIVVGGYWPPRLQSVNTEVCSINDEQAVSCISQKPEWTGYAYYPEFLLVSDSFCQ